MCGATVLKGDVFYAFSTQAEKKLVSSGEHNQSEKSI
jgi:hypothetical protein